MNYTDKMEQIKTIRELFDFRTELQQDAERNNDWGKDGLNTDKLHKCQEANHWVKLCDNRIDDLNKQGIWLDGIVIPTKEETKS